MMINSYIHGFLFVYLFVNRFMTCACLFMWLFLNTMDVGTTLKLEGELFGRAFAKITLPPKKKNNSQTRIAGSDVCIHN